MAAKAPPEQTARMHNPDTPKAVTASKQSVRIHIYALTAAFVAAVLALSFLAKKNVEDFENAIVAQTQRHLLTIAKSETIHFERFIDDVRDELKMLALNPQIQADIVRDNLLKDMSTNEGYAPGKLMCEHFAGRVTALYTIDADGIVKCRVPPNGRQSLDYSQKPGVKTVLEKHQPFVSGVFETNSGRKAISVCYPVFEDTEFTGVLRAQIH